MKFTKQNKNLTKCKDDGFLVGIGVNQSIKRWNKSNLSFLEIFIRIQRHGNQEGRNQQISVCFNNCNLLLT